MSPSFKRQFCSWRFCCPVYLWWMCFSDAAWTSVCLTHRSKISKPPIAELESIVKKLEEGISGPWRSRPEGVQLSRFCHARLEEAERRIEILTERGEIKAAPPSLIADDSERR